MIGVAIAGAGNFAAMHVRALAAVPGLRLVAVASGSPAASSAFAATHGGRPCDDWRRLLDDPEVDVVLVTAPHHLHAPISIAAAQAGKHVLVEKPMAPNHADCVAMTRAAQAAGVRLLVAHVMRFARPCLAAHALLASGTLGRPLFGRSATIKRWMDANRRPWHLTPEAGGGMLLTAGIHALDRLVWLMGSPVASVAAVSGHLFHEQRVPDIDLLLLRFASGAAGTLVSVGARDGTMINDTEIVCEDGILRLDLETGVSLGRDGRWTPLPDSSEPEWMLRGLEREWQAMRAAIRDGVTPPVGGAEAGALIACIDAARTAAAEQREVAVAPWPT